MEVAAGRQLPNLSALLRCQGPLPLFRASQTQFDHFLGWLKRFQGRTLWAGQHRPLQRFINHVSPINRRTDADDADIASRLKPTISTMTTTMMQFPIFFDKKKIPPASVVQTMSDMVTIFNGPDRFPTTRSVMTVLKYRFRVRQLRNLQNELRVVAQTQCVLPVTYIYVLEPNL